MNQHFKNRGFLHLHFSICIMLILCCGLNAQIIKPSAHGLSRTSTQTKTFKISDYERKLKENPDYAGYKTSENVDVEQNYTMDDQHFGADYNPKYVIEYLQTEKFPDGFTDFYIFDKNGILVEYERYFDDIETGIWKKYNREGKIINQENKDINYPFPIADVVAFSKKNNGDLSKSGSLKRSYDDQQKMYIYTIEWVVKNIEKPYTQVFILKGDNGEILKSYRKDPPKIKM